MVLAGPTFSPERVPCLTASEASSCSALRATAPQPAGYAVRGDPGAIGSHLALPNPGQRVPNPCRPRHRTPLTCGEAALPDPENHRDRAIRGPTPAWLP